MNDKYISCTKILLLIISQTYHSIHSMQPPTIPLTPNMKTLLRKLVIAKESEKNSQDKKDLIPDVDTNPDFFLTHHICPIKTVIAHDQISKSTTHSIQELECTKWQESSLEMMSKPEHTHSSMQDFHSCALSSTITKRKEENLVKTQQNLQKSVVFKLDGKVICYHRDKMQNDQATILQ